jgi:hypothetical protein
MLKSLRDFALQKPYMLALMGLLSNISGLVVSFAMRPNFDFLNRSDGIVITNCCLHLNFSLKETMPSILTIC